MAQKRNRKVAVVQCLGGCHAEAVIPRGDLAGIAARSWQNIRMAY